MGEKVRDHLFWTFALALDAKRRTLPLPPSLKLLLDVGVDGDGGSRFVTYGVEGVPHVSFSKPVSISSISWSLLSGERVTSGGGMRSRSSGMRRDSSTGGRRGRGGVTRFMVDVESVRSFSS